MNQINIYVYTDCLLYAKQHKGSMLQIYLKVMGNWVWIHFQYQMLAKNLKYASRISEQTLESKPCDCLRRNLEYILWSVLELNGNVYLLNRLCLL